MKTLHHSGFPCGINKKDLGLKLEELGEIEVVPCSEGYGIFSGRGSFWASGGELEEREADFSPAMFDEKGWYFFSPVEIETELTKNCNLNCSHCYNDSGKGEDFETGLLKRVLCEFRMNGGQKVKFTGGEPLKSRMFEEVIKYTHENIGIPSLEITTNATLIDSTVGKFLKSITSLSLSVSNLPPLP